MHEVRACGVLVVRGEPIESFLLMRHPHRLDLPKGHCEEGESDLDCALRELQEETGIAADDIELDAEFRFAIDYNVRYRSLNHELVHKTVVFFLARLVRDVEIRLTEHTGYAWFPWQPPQKIQKETIDPVLAAVAAHVEQKRTN